jgi:hypothetical protein
MKVRDDIGVKPCPRSLVPKIVKAWGLEDEILDPAYLHVIAHDDKEIIGMVTIFAMHPIKPVAHIIEHMRWKPGLSTRRILECAYAAISKISTMTQLMGYSRKKDENFFKKLRDLGVIRRIGKQSSGFDTMVTAWETKRPT